MFKLSILKDTFSNLFLVIKLNEAEFSEYWKAVLI